MFSSCPPHRPKKDKKKTRGPQALRSTEYQRLNYTDLLSEGHIFAYEQPHYNYNKMHARRTTDDDGRQPIVIGHLSNSGNLKINSKHGKL